MSFECFEVTIEDGVAHLAMNRPEKRNAMVRAFWSELPQIVRDIDDNARARVIVLSGQGPHFCAGIDLSMLADAGMHPGSEETEMGRRRHALRDLVKLLQGTFNALDEARIPVLAAIHGGCLGGAMDMISACDCRYAAEDAFFAIEEINIGMTADVGTFPRLCHVVPQGALRQMAYTGERISAAKAKEIGLVNEVYATREEMLAAVMEIAKRMASRSPLAVAGSKVMMNYARDHSIRDGLDYIATWQSGMFQPADLMESFSARAEGREGTFEDLLPRRRDV